MDPVHRYTIQTDSIRCSVLNLGLIIQSLQVLTPEGWIETVLNYPDVSSYEQDEAYIGAIVGRYANRIKQGTFTLQGKSYHIPTVNEGNALHGNHALDRKIWLFDEAKSSNNQLTFQCTSPHMEEGFPGNVAFEILFSLDGYSLTISYHATTDQATPISLTHHPYFNLHKDNHQSIMNTELNILMDHYLPLDDYMIPTGEIRSVLGTPFDFTSIKPINWDQKSAYDHCFVWQNPDPQLKKMASARSAETSIQLEVYSDLPGVQLYTGTFLPEITSVDPKLSFGPSTGFCLEPQYWPDSPNQDHFPSTIIDVDHAYHASIVYKLNCL